MFALQIICIASVLFYHISDNFKLGQITSPIDDTSFKQNSKLRCGQKPGIRSTVGDEDGTFRSKIDIVDKVDTTSNSDTKGPTIRHFERSSKSELISKLINILNVEQNGNGNELSISNKNNFSRSRESVTHQNRVNIRKPRDTDIRARVPKSNLTQICRHGECKQNKYQMCRCDEECERYCDCCHDAPYLFQDNVQRCQEVGQVLQCLVLPGQNYGMVGMIKCPKHNSTREFRNLCDDRVYSVHSLPPVVDDSNMVYKNKHCAECHGVTKVFDMQPSYACPLTPRQV